jgi:hypothetical protein
MSPPRKYRIGCETPCAPKGNNETRGRSVVIGIYIQNLSKSALIDFLNCFITIVQGKLFS